VIKMSEIPREMVLFPNEEQFDQKCGELQLGHCYWTIPTFPKNKEELVGSKIYFYDKLTNRIVCRATITKFDLHWEKKAVYFNLTKEDNEFNAWEYLDLDEMGIPPRKQSRGWAYRWFHIPENDDSIWIYEESSEE